MLTLFNDHNVAFRVTPFELKMVRQYRVARLVSRITGVLIFATFCVFIPILYNSLSNEQSSLVVVGIFLAINLIWCVILAITYKICRFRQGVYDFHKDSLG